MAKDDEIFDLDNLDKGIGKITNLITRLNEADAELVNLSKNALAASKALGGISTPGGLGKTQGDNAKILAELDKLKKKYAELEASIVKLNGARKQSEKLSLQEKVDARIRLQNDTAQAKAVSAEADAYQKLAAQLAAAQKNAQAIGATWGSDSKQFKTASDSVRKLDDEIKKIDSGIGKHQRNVGNYAGGWNALGNSVNQITREAPAAAVSMNTFFLAISNNLPAFFDALSGINEQNKQLASQGEKTVSVWKQLGSAIFSFQTLLSVGVTLLTLFGGKIIDLIFNTNELEKSLKKTADQQARFNKQLEDSNRNIEHNLVLEKNRRKLLGDTEKELTDLDKEAALQKLKNFEITRDANKKLLDDRVKFLLKEKDLSFTNYTFQIGLSEKLKSDQLRLEKEYNKAIHDNAYGSSKAIRDDAGKQAVALQAQLKDINRKVTADNALTQDEIFKKRRDGYIKANNEAVLYGQQVSELFSNLSVTEQEAEEDRLANLAEMNKAEIELLIAKNDVLLNDEESYYSDRFSALNNDLRLRKRLAELDRDEEIRLAKNSYEKQQTALLNFQIKQIELIQSHAKKRAEIEKLDLDPIRELLNTDFRKDLMKPVEESVKKANKELLEYQKRLQAAEAATLKLQAATKAWLDTFSTDVLQSAGMSSLGDFFDSTFKNLVEGAETTEEQFAVYFNSIAESAQEAFNFISQITTKNFDGEKQRLEEQYNVSLKYAGDNKEAQAKLAEDLEAQKKAIATREAKAKKQQALVNIAIDTAQAIVGLWANPGFPAAIPLAILVGGLGLAQAAIVNAQEIPQFYMGGEHSGGLMKVNDGAGANFRETIVTPDGNIHKPEGRNVIMNAPAGTKIYTHNQWNDWQKEQLMPMLAGRNILPSISEKEKGMTKDDFYDVMSETLGGQIIERSNLDANGFSKYTIKRGNITRRNYNRANGKRS